ncbi:ABC transporter substrate-binding protein [Nocardiopsis sediminis]|uniref:ABC transporter substrate-binding protein n=1 Tax=Nocardiopsis sediminis TaxID=1778267 RepID=A0ABV8FPM0_9ACTN
MTTAALAAVGALLTSLTACASGASDDEADAAPRDTVDAAAHEAVAVEAGLSVTDPRGEQVELDSPPERIVCLVALCDDILTELEITPVATSNPDLLAHEGFLGPDHDVPVIPGGFGGEDVEEILRHEPDLVIGLAGSHEGLAPSLEGTAPVWLTDSRSWEDSVDYLRAVAALTDRGAEQQRAEQAFYDTLAEAQADAEAEGLDTLKPLVLYGSDGAFQVDSRGSIVGGLLDQVVDYDWEDRSTGGHQAGGSDYSIEEILAGDPDIIFLESFTFSPGDSTLTEQLADDPVWQQISAVEQGRVHEVDLAPWATGRGTRSLGIVLDDTMRYLRG